jgi:hypothetical protein
MDPQASQAALWVIGLCSVLRQGWHIALSWEGCFTSADFQAQEESGNSRWGGWALT